MLRFGVETVKDIEENIELHIEKNNQNQFNEFFAVKSYKLEKTTYVEDLFKILQDWDNNMRNKNGSQYKETVVKTEECYC